MGLRVALGGLLLALFLSTLRVVSTRVVFEINPPVEARPDNRPYFNAGDVVPFEERPAQSSLRSHERHLAAKPFL